MGAVEELITDVDSQLRINRPDVMSEIIDGEVIAIHLVSGNYFSITGAGTDVWELMSEAGSLAPSEIVDVLSRRYDAERSEIEPAVVRFLNELRHEGLVADSQGTGAQTGQDEENGAAKRAFVRPRIETYTDMQDLVLLDPVHQVDELGWPHVHPDAARPERGARST